MNLDFGNHSDPIFDGTIMSLTATCMTHIERSFLIVISVFQIHVVISTDNSFIKSVINDSLMLKLLIPFYVLLRGDKADGVVNGV